MTSRPATVSAPAALQGERRRLLLAYAGLGLLCWTLYAVAVTDWQRGSFSLLEAAYQATWMLWPALLLGLLVLPWVRLVRAASPRLVGRVALHGVGALVFVGLWQGAAYLAAHALYGAEHAAATAEQQLVWLGVLGVLVYAALVLGFGGVLHARQARGAALAAERAQAALALNAAQSEAALVKAELAAISGKLNPHFLFNTLNSLRLLINQDPQAAEQSLLCFSRMMRYVLDTQRGTHDRVRLGDELDFVRDYLALEALRLGPRLRVDWQIDPATLDAAVPPLTLQPLVENSINHGIAPRVQGGTVHIHSRHQAVPGIPGAALALRVADDGEGCVWPPATPPLAPTGRPRRGGGVGLGALLRRFELDYDGQAQLDVRSAPGKGFCVDILIPLHP
jgi:Histidine kinase